jgi:serine/threonine-protein kinase RsbW
MTDVVTLLLPAEPAYIRLARLVGAGLAGDLEFDIERLDDVRLAIGEACSLVVQGGAEGIEVSYAGRDGRLEVSGRATGSAPPGGSAPIPELRRLVDQILSVACTDHRIDADEGLTFWLAFAGDHGR